MTLYVSEWLKKIPIVNQNNKSLVVTVTKTNSHLNLKKKTIICYNTADKSSFASV